MQKETRATIDGSKTLFGVSAITMEMGKGSQNMYVTLDVPSLVPSSLVVRMSHSMSAPIEFEMPYRVFTRIT